MREIKAKAMLENVYFYKHTLKKLYEDLEEVRLQIGVKASGSSEVKGKDITQEDLICEKLDLESIIKNYEKLYEEAKKKVLPYIDKIPSKIYRDVLICRYIKAMSWKAIARKYGYTDTYLRSDLLRMALKEMTEKK